MCVQSGAKVMSIIFLSTSISHKTQNPDLFNMNTEAVINLNNQTVDLLERQDPLNAVESSANLSCCQLKKTLDASSATQEGANYRECIDRCIILPESGQTVAYSMDTVICKHGIPLPPSASDIATMITSIAVFNAAVAHHRMAENGGTSAKGFLHKAKALYELAYKTTDMDENPVFIFAVLNNIGVIERQLGNAAASNQYFDYLSYLLERRETL